MITITDYERQVLEEWIPGSDFSNVRIRCNAFSEIFCRTLGAQAVTIGRSIFVRKKSWIARYPPDHPLRLSLLVHEFFHIQQEQATRAPFFAVRYAVIAIILVVRAFAANRIFWPRKVAKFIGENHSLEKPAYELQQQFLEKYWTIDDAVKWNWRNNKKERE